MHDAVLSFDDYLGRYLGPPSQPESAMTLREYYLSDILPEIDDQAPASLSEDRTAIKNWELHTGNPELRMIGKTHLTKLRDGMTEAGRKPATINKTLREVKAMLTVALEEGVISEIPKIKRRMKSKLVKEPPKIQRDIITRDELTRLWHACEAATYPNPKRYPTARIWRGVLLMFYLYGPRTLDLFRLSWDSVKPRGRLIQFEAMKTRKLQGLPLTDLVLGHLNALRGADPIYIFGPMRSKGSFLRKQQRWQRGYYTTWRTEILPAANIDDPIVFKHFRETMVSTLNGVEPQLGNWIAGHYMPGVSNQSYDLPTRRIREAIESVEIPDCFRLIDSAAG